MSKLFGYELQRLLWNKLFFGILLVTLGYSRLTLTGAVILGVAHTAPFSPWSFGYYLSRVLPLICLGELFFLSFFTSREELRIRPVTQATPMDRRRYTALRCGAVLTGTLLLSLSVAALAIVFYVRLFGWMDFGDLVLPALLTLLPPAFFCLGAGLALGRVHPSLIYLLMAGVFLASVLPLPSAVSFSLGDFFAQAPLELDGLDPAFSVMGPLLWGRCLWFAAGAALLFCRLSPNCGNLKIK